jgi:hypothetical protein
MTVELDLTVVLWVLGVFSTIFGTIAILLYNWIQKASSKINALDIKLSKCISEERAEAIVKNEISPISDSMSICRKDMGRLTHELNATINVIRTNMNDLMIKLVR